MSRGYPNILRLLQRQARAVARYSGVVDKPRRPFRRKGGNVRRRISSRPIDTWALYGPFTATSRNAGRSGHTRRRKGRR